MISDSDRALLDFEEGHPERSARRAGLIIRQFRISETRYTQRLLALVVLPEVVEAYPQLAKRVQEGVRGRAGDRAARRLG